jgi:MFS family permease
MLRADVVTIWGYFAVASILSSFDSVLPLFVQGTFGWSQTWQGLIFLPLSLPHSLSPVFGRLNNKYSKTRRYLAGGSFLGNTVACVLLRFVSNDAPRQNVLRCALIAVLELSIAVVVPGLIAEAVYAVLDEEERKPGVFGKTQPMALVNGILTSAFSVGAMAGPFLAGYIRVSAGWDTRAWVFGLVAGVSAIPMLLFLGGFSLARLDA